MTICFYCGIDFLLLPGRPGDNSSVRCGKCMLRTPGLSVPEIAMINVGLLGFFRNKILKA